MTVHSILEQLISGDMPRALEIFAPELVLCLTIVSLLLVRLFGCDKRLPGCWVALIGSLLAFTAVFAQFMFLKTGPVEGGALGSLYSLAQISDSGVGSVGEFFTGLMMHDHFTLFIRLGLMLFSVLVVALTVLTGIPDNDDGPDFYALLLGAIVGMMVATSANHLLMLFLGVEMMSVPSYAMVGFLKGRRKSSEAALKYVVYGAGAAGVMLYGISLLAGILGTAEFPELAARFVTVMNGQEFGLSSTNSIVLVLAIMMVLVGLAFKLSLVPFHFWCPDAFEGAAAEVGGFLSVASKAASFAILVRFLLSFTGTEESLVALRLFLGLALAVIAGASMTLGNLAAYSQTNVKRLLAYSTIAHAGYMLMAVAALLVLVDAPVTGDWTRASLDEASIGSMEALMYYLAVYLFMNLVAFGVVALLRNEIYSEEISDYGGLIHQNTATKVLVICMALALFSLIGLPPFGGFFAKMEVFYAVLTAANIHWGFWVLLVVAGANTVFSLFYYLRVIKAMCIDPAPEGRRQLTTQPLIGTYIVLITLPIFVLGASPLQDDLTATARYVATFLLG